MWGCGELRALVVPEVGSIGVGREVIGLELAGKIAIDFVNGCKPRGVLLPIRHREDYKLLACL